MQVKKIKKYVLRGFISLFGLLLICWISLYVFFVIKKETIRKNLSVEIGNAINGDAIIGDIGMNFFNLFPNVSLSMKKVEIRDSAWKMHRQSFLKAEKIFLKIDPLSLMAGDIRISKVLIEDAGINSFTDSTGYSNEYLLSPKPRQKENNKGGFHLEKIAFKNVRIIRADSNKNKLYDLSFEKLKCEVDKKSGLLQLDLKMDVLIHSLAFNTRKGSYARGKVFKGEFKMVYDPSQKLLSFQNIRAAIDHHPYKFSGSFDFRHSDFRLDIVTNKIAYSKAMAVLPEQISRKLIRYNVDKPFNVRATIQGKLTYRSLPRVAIETDIANSHIHTPAGEFTNAGFSGKFLNNLNDALPNTDENSQLVFNNVTATWESVPFVSKQVTITNLDNPFLKSDIKARTDLSSLNDLLNSASFDFLSGTIEAEGTYTGSLLSDTGTSLNGQLMITDGKINYAPRQIKLENIDGKLLFKNEDVEIQDLNANAQGNKVNINATVRNMINLLTKDPSKLSLDAEIISPSLDLLTFRTMLGSRKKKRTTSRGKFARLAEKIDRFMEVTSINTHLKAGKLKYKNFDAGDVDAVFSMNADTWNMKKIVLKHADGFISMNGTLTYRQQNYNAVEVNADMSGVDIAKVFKAFSNFGLESLHAENLKGRLSTNIHLTGVLDDESRMISSLLSGTAAVSIKNGELIDFGPLQNMSVFVLKKRDFSRVEFAEIRNTFVINGPLITINKMEVQSNVLGFLLEGIYDIKGKNTDLVVQLPIKYLKKRDPSYVPRNEGVDAKKGISIYVRATNGENGQIDFKYGLFRKKSVLEKTIDHRPRATLPE